MPPKGTNSSKTEHVMNLLRKSGSAETPRQAVAEENATAAASASKAAPRNKLPILTALNADVEVSSKIKDALESALLIEEATPSPVATLDMYADTDEPVVPAPAPKAAPAPVEVAEPAAPAPAAIPAEPPVAAPAPAATPAPAAAPAPVSPIPAPAPQTAAPTPAPAPAAAPAAESSGKLSQDEIERMLRAMVEETEAPPAPAPAPQPAPIPEPVPAPVPEVKVEPTPEPEDKAELFNIMQLLAEEKADKYIKMFGLCDCKRCRQDVLALTLNEISTKYVVMPRAELTIRNDMYRSHYDGEITVQILRACQKVMEHPRHKK